MRTDVSPKLHPGPGRILPSFEPIGLGCVIQALILVYSAGVRLPSESRAGEPYCNRAATSPAQLAPG